MATLLTLAICAGPRPPLSSQILRNQCRDQLVFPLILQLLELSALVRLYPGLSTHMQQAFIHNWLIASQM